MLRAKLSSTWSCGVSAVWGRCGDYNVGRTNVTVDEASSVNPHERLRHLQNMCVISTLRHSTLQRADLHNYCHERWHGQWCWWTFRPHEQRQRNGIRAALRDTELKEGRTGRSTLTLSTTTGNGCSTFSSNG